MSGGENAPAAFPVSHSDSPALPQGCQLLLAEQGFDGGSRRVVTLVTRMWL